MRTEEEKAYSRLRTEMHAAFGSGKIFSESEETLQKYLASLCTENVPNVEVRHREIIKALTINHIQMQRHIDKLNEQAKLVQEQGNKLQKQNNRLQKIIIVLATIATFTGITQIYVALKPPRSASHQLMQPLSTSQSPSNQTFDASKGSMFGVHPFHAKPIQAISGINHRGISIKSDIRLESDCQGQNSLQTSPSNKEKIILQSQESPLEPRSKKETDQFSIKNGTTHK